MIMLTAGEGVGKFSVDGNIHGAKIQPHPRSLSRGKGGLEERRDDRSGIFKIANRQKLKKDLLLNPSPDCSKYPAVT